MYSKYLDYYEPATKAHESAQAECFKKDVIIGQIKGELQQLKKIEGDYYRLNQLINILEGKYSLLIAEKQRSQKEQRIKSELDKKTIIELRSDIDGLRVQLQKANLVIDELIQGNQNIKRQVDARTTEIQSLRFQIKEIENKNQRNNDENRTLALNIKALKEERKRIETECEDLSAVLDQNMNKLKNLQKDVRSKESNNTRLQKILYQAEKDNSKMVGELKERNEELKKTEIRLKGINNEISDQSITYRNLEQQSNKSKNQLDRNTVILEKEIQKGKEIQNKISAVEGSIRTQENQLDLAIAEEQDLRKIHFASIDRNKQLNLEIDQVLALITEYEQVNRQLLDEIQYFVEQDQQARSMLDRGEVMREIIEGSIRKIALTQEPIKHLKC